MSVGDIQITELEIDTSFGVTVIYNTESVKGGNLKQAGARCPSEWTDSGRSCDEFDRGETISEEVLEGRLAGARREAEIILAKEVCGDDYESARSVSVEELSIPSSVLQDTEIR